MNNSRRNLNVIGKMTNRRSRTPNWSLEEKQFLLELIKERKEVVITKYNNGPKLCEEKDLAWNDILRELESKFGTRFSRNSMKKVKTQWQNMKRIARDEIAANGPCRQKYTKQSLDVCSLLDLPNDFVLNTDNDSTETPAIREMKTEIVYEEENERDSEDINNITIDLTELVTSAGQKESNQAISSLKNGNEPFEIYNGGANKHTMDVDMTKNATIGNSVKQPSSVEITANINPFHRDMPIYFIKEVENEKDFEELNKTKTVDFTESVTSGGQKEPTRAISSLIMNDNEPFEIYHEGANKDMIKNTTIGNSVQQPSLVEATANINPFHRDLPKSCRCTVAEKQLKLETLREEQLIVKTMKETANINKIIAERRLKQLLWVQQKQMAMYSGEPGSGAGRGGGGGGAIREAGGSFGKMEAVREDEYFYKKQREQLTDIKNHLSKEITFHEDQIKHHEDAIRRHREQMSHIDKK